MWLTIILLKYFNAKTAYRLLPIPMMKLFPIYHLISAIFRLWKLNQNFKMKALASGPFHWKINKNWYLKVRKLKKLIMKEQISKKRLLTKEPMLWLSGNSWKNALRMLMVSCREKRFSFVSAKPMRDELKRFLIRSIPNTGANWRKYWLAKIRGFTARADCWINLKIIIFRVWPSVWICWTLG